MVDLKTLPVVILTTIITLIILVVGVYTIFTLNPVTTPEHTEAFALSNSSDDQSLKVDYTITAITGATQTIANGTTLTIPGANLTFSTTSHEVGVDSGIIYGGIKENNIIGSAGGNVTAYQTALVAQEFVVGTNGTGCNANGFDINYIKVLGTKKGGNSFGNAWFNITAVNATGFATPQTGTVYSSGYLNASTVTEVTPTGDWYRVDMSDYYLVPGTTYALVMEDKGADGTACYFAWNYIDSSGYSIKGCNTSASGTVWFNNTVEQAFMLYPHNTSTITITGENDLVATSSENVLSIIGIVIMIGAILLIVGMVWKGGLFGGGET